MHDEPNYCTTICFINHLPFPKTIQAEKNNLLRKELQVDISLFKQTNLPFFSFLIFLLIAFKTNVLAVQIVNIFNLAAKHFKFPAERQVIMYQAKYYYNFIACSHFLPLSLSFFPF